MSDTLPLKEAKEIYFEFLGSQQYMERENVYGQYNNFNVTVKQEEQWRAELIAEKCSKLPGASVLSDLSIMVAHEAIPILIQFNNQGDGFFRCRLAEPQLSYLYS